MPQLSATTTIETSERKRLNRVPLSTYRLQLNSHFNLEQASALLDYLQQLGVSELYLSPLFRAREESSHGYDVVDHGTIDPAIGELAAFRRLAESAREAGLGILLDVVPNHMGINDAGNAWWLDVLENGEGSYFAEFFDIDWHPAASALDGKILLPFLGEPFGRVLENGDLQVVYADERFQLSYGPRRFPLAPPTWSAILELAVELGLAQSEAEGANAQDWIELQSIVTQLHNVPPAALRDSAAMETRYREQHVARRRLATLLRSAPGVKKAIEGAICQLNGEKGNPKSFDPLERLLDQQAYRLAYWRVAADEINYRRFFDINELAAIRVEDPRVFEAVHRLVGYFLQEGWITGLRVDHPDGLRDPQSYFKNLQSLYRDKKSAEHNPGHEIYVVAEKILSGDEALPTEWQIAGTTGYDFLNIISRLQVSHDGLQELRAFYDVVRDHDNKPADVVYESKRAVLLHSMASELQMLTAQLYRITQQHRAARDFTRSALQRALREVIACMTVYRSYVRSDSWDVSEADYRIVTSAVRMAKRRNRTMPMSVFDFIASVVLLEHPPGLIDEQASNRRQFALKLQQVSGPVAAKGVEDTAFYRYYPLASLNEVGGELDVKPLAIDEFHRLMRQRQADWPHSLSATATHDSKRGEDLRARLHVLSEVPDQWFTAFQRWQSMNGRFSGEVDGETVPDANEQYLLYQTLVGTWPTKPWRDEERQAYTDRIVQYMEKALREAKIHTSWLNPSDSYEAAVFDFVRSILGDQATEFQVDMTAFVSQIADNGFVNALVQLLLKITLPGVPDFYQGSELWDFNLVDPDNRRPVDFAERRTRLERLSVAASTNLEQAALSVSARWPDSDVKLWVTSRALQLRRQWPDVFSFGEYIPLETNGIAAEHVVAFARQLEDQWIVVVVPRHCQQMYGPRVSASSGPPHAEWNDSQLLLPEASGRTWRCALSGRAFEAEFVDDSYALAVGPILDVLPVALLTLQAN